MMPFPCFLKVSSLFRSASCEVLHGAPGPTSWCQEEFIRDLLLETSKKLVSVGFQVKVPTSLIAKDLDMGTHAISHLRGASIAAVNFPNHLLR